MFANDMIAELCLSKLNGRGGCNNRRDGTLAPTRLLLYPRSVHSSSRSRDGIDVSAYWKHCRIFFGNRALGLNMHVV